MGVTKALGAAIRADVCGRIGAAPEVAMLRGMKQAPRATGQMLRVIDTPSLRSGSGSRSEGIVDNESMSDLVASIASVGIIEPIVVRQIEANCFVIVAGERRFAAAKSLGLEQVPCVITQCTDGEALVISLTENLQRSDLDAIEKARALRRLIEEFKLTQQEIGQRVGMSQSAIAHHLRLLALPEEVRRMISDGVLSVGHGKVLAGIQDEQEAIEVALDSVAQNKSVREVEESLAFARGKTDKRPPRGSVRNRREEHELRNGLFLVIKESREERGSGTIEIPYYSLDEKNWVLKALSEELEAKRRNSLSKDKPASALRVQGRPAFQPTHGSIS